MGRSVLSPENPTICEGILIVFRMRKEMTPIRFSTTG